MNSHHLDQLSVFRQALLSRDREVAEAAARAREQQVRERSERDLFALTVGPVTPIRQSQTVRSASGPRPPARARQRERDEAAVMLDAISDDFDVESLLDTDDLLSFRRPDIGPEVVRKLRRGVWAIQAQLDLHGLRRDEARERLGRFMLDARRAGLRCVRVIHGKGNGSPGRVPVLKHKVQAWLVQKKEVIAFTQARPADGGNGALMVLLAPQPVRPKPQERGRPIPPIVT